VGSLLLDAPNLGGTGDGDARLEPGERARLAVDVVNRGNRPATGVRGLMVAIPATGIVVTDTTASWPVLQPAREARTNGGSPPHFEVTPDPDAACGGDAYVSVSVTYAGPAGGYSVSQEIVVRIGNEREVDVYSDDFESGAAGWVHGTDCTGFGCNPSDDWELATPLGLGLDPSSARSGSMAWGNDLASDGFYEWVVDNWLESPPIDCTGRTGVRVSFWRWLTVKDGVNDQATVEVDGQPVWSNPIGDGSSVLVDTQWTYQEIDIGAQADGDSDVRVRFRLRSNFGQPLGGWTVDDVRVFQRVPDCTVGSACMTPAAAEPTGPWLRATGRKGPSNVELTWAGVRLAPGDEFRLFRGTDPADVSMRVTPLGYVSTSFDDTAAPDALYYYLLRLATCAGDLGPPSP
jgi:hypothetical protein